MSNQSAGFTSLRIFAIGLLLVTCWLWFRYETDPNTRFRRLQAAFDEAYQATLSQPFDTLQLGILEPRHVQARLRIFTYFYPKFIAYSKLPLQPNYQKKWQQTNDLIQFQMRYLPTLQKNPLIYNFGAHLKKTLKLKGIALDKRLQQVENQLPYAPAYYTIAKDNLVTPDSTKFQLAMKQQLQVLHFLQYELLDSLSQSGFSKAQRSTFLAHTRKAKIAVKDYVAFCRSIWFEYQATK